MAHNLEAPENYDISTLRLTVACSASELRSHLFYSYFSLAWRATEVPTPISSLIHTVFKTGFAAGRIHDAYYLGAFSIEVNKTRAIEKANDRMHLPNLDQRDGLEPSFLELGENFEISAWRLQGTRSASELT